jgi:hypothetical protein
MDRELQAVMQSCEGIVHGWAFRERGAEESC